MFMVGTWPQAGHHPDWGKMAEGEIKGNGKVRGVQSFLGKAGSVWFSRRRTRSGPENTCIYESCGVPGLDYKMTLARLRCKNLSTRWEELPMRTDSSPCLSTHFPSLWLPVHEL